MTTLAVSPPDQRRRREDWAQSRTLLDTVRMLMSRPTGDEIAQQLVLNLLGVHEPKTAVICLFGADGALHAAGAFGLAGQALDVFATMSLWDASPMADCVRTHDMIILTTGDQVADRYPWLAAKGRPCDPLAVAPLSVMNQPVGVLQVTFATQPDAASVRADLAGLTSVLALYFSLARGRIGAVADIRHSTGSTAFPSGDDEGIGMETMDVRPPSPEALTDRQLEILRLMARGLTNAQIAKRIGFSDSTVRQETMAIYRVFAVGGRRDAIQMAAARGMLAEQDA